MLNALTIDIEDYFMVSAFSEVVSFGDWKSYESRVERATAEVLELLGGRNLKATFFILGWVAEHHPAIVRDIARNGHEIACHGYNHRLAYSLSRDEFREDIRRARGIIEDVSGKRVRGYRAPSYSITRDSMWALDVLIEEGFAYDSSIFPIHHDRYGYHDFSRFAVNLKRDGVGNILELPLSTVRLFGKNIPIAGGGYLRMFPVKFLEWGIHYLNKKERQPAIIYFHPWEMDTGQPRIKGNGISRFRHYVNIDKTASKLERLLARFRFGTIEEVFAERLKR